MVLHLHHEGDKSQVNSVHRHENKWVSVAQGSMELPSLCWLAVSIRENVQGGKGSWLQETHIDTPICGGLAQLLGILVLADAAKV